MSLTAFFYDDVHQDGVDEEMRFKSREEDPLGDWEHSPDGSHVLGWKDPSKWPSWARVAKRWNMKWRVDYKKAFLAASWLFQLATGDSEYFSKIANEFETEVERTCPHCEADYVIPPQLWGGVAYCPRCGGNAEEIAWQQVVRKYRKILAATLPLEPRDRSLGYKPEPDPWVPLPLNGDESEEKPAQPPRWRVDWKSVEEASKDMKALYEATKAKKFSYEEASLLWEKAKARKKKLLAYREMAKKRLLRLYADAESKTLRGQGTLERVEEWTEKLPVSKETREFIKARLERNLQFWQKGLTYGSKPAS